MRTGTFHTAFVSPSFYTEIYYHPLTTKNRYLSVGKKYSNPMIHWYFPVIPCSNTPFTSMDKFHFQLLHVFVPTSPVKFFILSSNFRLCLNLHNSKNWPWNMSMQSFSILGRLVWSLQVFVSKVRFFLQSPTEPNWSCSPFYDSKM